MGADRIADLRRRFEAVARPDDARHMERYMKDRYAFYGLKKPLRQQLWREHVAAYPLPKSEEDLLDLAVALYDEDYRELHYAALDTLQARRRYLTAAALPILAQLITTHAWWDTVDWLAIRLVGDVLRRYPEERHRLPDTWVTHDNMWLRRTAILYQLKYKHETSTEQLYRYCELECGSQEFFIQKAMGWALREYAKTDPDSVVQFVESTDLPKLTVREALRRLK